MAAPFEEPPSASSSSEEEEDSSEESSLEEEALNPPPSSSNPKPPSSSGSDSESLASKRATENNNNGTDSDSKKDVGKSLVITEMIRFIGEIGLSGAMKRGMELIGEADKAMLAESWKKVRIAEMKVLNTRAELVRNLTASIIEAYENSN